MPKEIVDVNMSKEEKYAFYESYCKHCPNVHVCIDDGRCMQGQVKKYFLKNYRQGIRSNF